MRDPKYYVRRLECWGGTYVWCVAARDGGRQVTSALKTEAGAIKLRDRMESDYNRYRVAMLEKLDAQMPVSQRG